MALVGLDYLKDYLSIPQTVTAQDTQLQIFLDQAEAMFKAQVGRDIEQKTYPSAAEGGTGDDGYYSGKGVSWLRLRNFPVSAVSAVYLDSTGRFGQNPDGSFSSTVTLLVYGTDYVLKTDGCLPGTSTKCSYSGMIQRVGTVWPNRAQYTPGNVTLQPIDGLGNIKVVYTAGYPVIPHDVRGAVCQIAAYIRRNADKGGPIASESLGGYSYSLGASNSGGVPELGTVRSVISKYKGAGIVL